MRRLSSLSLRASLSLLIACSLIFATPFSLRLVSARGERVQSPNRNDEAPATYLAAIETMLRSLKVWWQGGGQLDTMRSTQPAPPNAYQQTGSLPASGSMIPNRRTRATTTAT